MTAPRDRLSEPVHPLTKRPMKRCPSCNRWSGLSGLDGGKCLACSLAALSEQA